MRGTETFEKSFGYDAHGTFEIPVYVWLMLTEVDRSDQVVED